jgi:predicted O-linked N-acetylglucosamine transferase (SPINDLY family)
MTVNLNYNEQFYIACQMAAKFVEQNDYRGAIEAYKTALAAEQKLSQEYLQGILTLLGQLHYKIQEFEEAKKYLEWSLTANPKQKQLNYMLGNIYMIYYKDYDKAISLYEEELKIDPGSSWVYTNMSVVYFARGQVKQAIAMSEKAAECDPKNQTANSNVIMQMHYDKDASVADILLAGQKYYNNCFPELAAQKHNYQFPHLDLSPEKTKLHIGYASGDFRKHAILFWLRGLFAERNKERIEIFCYANNQEDEGSELFRKESDHWFNIKKLNDQEVYAKIQEDKIDVLVDLSGHTGLNRLGVFVLKPAPVQVTWLGQAGPTGIPQMDYMISDRFLVLEGEESDYNEKIYRMPNFFAPYNAPANTEIPVMPIPVLNNNYITFGSFNNFIKINEQVLECWAKILKRLDNSKILFKNQSMQDPSVQNYVTDFMSKQDVDPKRIITEPSSSDRRDYLKKFNDVDIALDPFPLGGGTTSHDTLWMSTPIITLYGNKMSNRITSSVLKVLGCDELVAKDLDEYIDKAVDLASDHGRMQDYNQTLRQRYLSSVVCDLKRFADDLEQAYRYMWQEFCATNHVTDK